MIKLSVHSVLKSNEDMDYRATPSHSERPSDAQTPRTKYGDNKHASTSVSHFKQVKHLDTESGAFRRAERILTPPAKQDIGLVHGMFPIYRIIMCSS